MAGLHGILIGVGEILAGLIFGIFGGISNKVGRWPIVVLGKRKIRLNSSHLSVLF